MGNLTLLLATLVPVAVRAQADGTTPVDPIEYIRSSLQSYPIVCLAEGGHATREAHLFLRQLLGNRSVLEAVDVIIVEFAAGRYQAVLDAYIRGEDVPLDDLSHVWRDTQQSPIGPWDSPLYQELLEVIRDTNRGLPVGQKVRVLAGDPPIDWDQIRTGEDYRAAVVPRDPYVAEMAMEQAFGMGQRVLVLFGGAHLPRTPIGAGDPRNSITFRILSLHPDAVHAISFLIPEDLHVEDRIGELVPGSVYLTKDHWSGELNGGLVFPKIFMPVLDPSTGEEEWQEVVLYSDYRVHDLFDALVYLGPTSNWKTVEPSFDPDRDKAYLAELNRRSMLRFGRPYGTGG